MVDFALVASGNVGNVVLDDSSQFIGVGNCRNP